MVVLNVYIGIGAAIAIELARRGASVLITYVSSAKGAAAVVDDIEKHGASGHAIQADSAKAAESAEKIITECGTIFSDGIDII
uniref:SDR family NAD(P)-dependent oxidoreductase n=1 Tax=Mycobacterium tuberculosis TaxID=1773 RepID=UPI00254B3A0F